MSVTQRRATWTWESYLEWEVLQEQRHELVDNEVRAMTGRTRRHDRIGNNLRAALDRALEGRSSRPHGPDFKVHAGESGRYLDALVDCGPDRGDDLVASDPAAVFEVLSPGSMVVDRVLKLRDYGGTPSIRTYAIVDATRPRILVYRRDVAGRLSSDAPELLEALDATLALPELGIAIPLAGLSHRHVRRG